MQYGSNPVAPTREQPWLNWSRKAVGSRPRLVFMQMCFIAFALGTLACIALLQRIAGIDGMAADQADDLGRWVLALLWSHVAAVQVLLPCCLLLALRRLVIIIDGTER